MKTISSMGIASIVVDSDEKTKYWHIFAIGTNNVKVYFTEEGKFTEDEKLKAESNDFNFVYEILGQILQDEKIQDDLVSSLIF